MNEDPTCPRCGGYFDEDRPYWARGMHRKCYLSAYYYNQLDLYPRQRVVGTRSRRVLVRYLPPKPLPCPQCGRETCHAVSRCHKCVINLRLLLSSAMQGFTLVRHCPHLIERKEYETTAS